MSEKAIYLTYFQNGDFIKFYYNFLNEKCKNIVSSLVLEKLEKLMKYEISDQSKWSELNIVLQEFKNSLTDDENLKVENELNNRIDDYYKTHQRELEKTEIVKINLDEFEIKASGNIPGRFLNQFSLDEYNDHLRVATTIGDSGFFGGSRESANDIYVLDKNLKITGSIENLGLTEKIYSVRFIENKGYAVTFRQTDPFYVLDLSNPQKPEMKGELKIPGYSSYLHPINKDKILGIGMENQKVKISLFNVEKPDQPKELDKYLLDEHWSEILQTHHAFLLDEKHQIFFLPGSKGGYIFSYFQAERENKALPKANSYQGNKLKLIKTISQTSVKRALFINDYLYIIGNDKITIIDETNWEKVNELIF